MGSYFAPLPGGNVNGSLRPMFGGDLSIATIMVDSNGRIIYFGPHAEVLTGFRRGTVIGRDIQVLISVPGDNSVKITDLPIDMNPQVHEIRTSDGNTRTVHLYRHPVPQPGEQPAILLMAVDVSDTTEASVGLGLLNGFFKQSSVGFVILDTRLRYVALNEAMAELNHRSVFDHLGRHLSEVIDPPDLSAYEALLYAVLESGEPVNNLRVPVQPTSSPGQHFVRSVSWYRLTEEPERVIGLCGIVSDITDTESTVLQTSQSHSRLALLSKVGATLGISLDIEETAKNLASTLASDHCDLVTVDVVSTTLHGDVAPEPPGQDTLVTRVGAATRITIPNVTDILTPLPPERPASQTSAFFHALVTNRPQVLQYPASGANPDLSLPPLPSGRRALGPHSAIIAPLQARGSTLGALTCVRMAEREPFTHEDLLVISEIANTLGLCIDNARLYRNEKQTAMTLQQSLLPQRLPDIPEATLTHAYRTNRVDLHAGGDWFDTIELPGRRVALVVGDVAGHGIGSAAAMGNFRTAVRSLASIGMDPATLLTRLNDLSQDFGENVTASCIYVVYDPLQHWCVMASAGHPPPVLVLPGTAAEARHIAGGPILGAVPNADYRATSMATPPGTRLLLYTDGIVESRTASFDDGVDRLVRRMRSGLPAAKLCEQLMAESPSAEDDRTLLLAEFHGLNPHMLKARQ